MLSLWIVLVFFAMYVCWVAEKFAAAAAAAAAEVDRLMTVDQSAVRGASAHDFDLICVARLVLEIQHCSPCSCY